MKTDASISDLTKKQTTVGKVVERLRELPKDDVVVSFEMKYFDKLNNQNKIEYHSDK